MAVRPFAYISVALNRLILVKFDIGDFDEKLLKNCKIVKNLAEVSHILHEDPTLVDLQLDAKNSLFICI